MAVCVTCGTDNPDHHRFCSRCGARLVVEQRAEPSKAPPSAEMAERLLDQAFQYSDEGRLEEAVSAAEQAVAANPNSTSAHSLLGILYERAGQRQKAIAEYERALALSPRSTADREALRQLIAAPGARGRPAVVRGAIFAAFMLACGLLIAGIGLFLRTGPAQQPMIAVTQPGSLPSALGGFPVPPTTVPSRPVMPQKPAPTSAVPAQPSRSAPVPPAPQALPQGRTWPSTGLANARPVSPVRAQPVGSAPAISYPTPQPTPDRPVRIPPPVTLREGPAPARPAPSAAVVPSQEIARAYYFQRDYPKAIEAYERLVESRPQVRAHVREELAWCYYQAGREADAVAQYRSALAAYEKEREQEETRQDAEHGIRTCQAALKALQAR